MKKIFLLLFICFSLGLSAQSLPDLEKQLSEAQSSEEKMVLQYEIASLLISKDRDKAEKSARAAYKIAQDKRNAGMQTQAAFLLGRINEKKRDKRNAKVWFESALKHAKQAQDANYIIRSVEKVSDIYTRDRKFRDAYNVARDAFKYFSTEGQSLSEIQSNFSAQKARISREERNLKKQKDALERQITSLQREYKELTETNTDLSIKTERLETEKTQIEEEKVLIEEEKQKIEALVDEQEDEINKMSAAQLKIELKNERLGRLTAESENKLKAAELKNEQNRLYTLGLSGLAALLVLTALLLYLRFRSKQKTAKELAEKNQIIEAEKQRSEDLLLNTLPKEIADELKEYGKVKAKKYNDATVLFTDFKNFTSIAERLSPEQLVKELDNCFKAFDFIIGQYKDIEKIKTIGDAYMAASGLTDRKNLPTNLIKAALEMQQFLDEVKAERQAQGLPYFEARIGLHTGPVVAGVVGVKKFAYDIWGDTVNIAARMEANCEPGKVNVSETTHNMVKYEFSTEYRGKVSAKNKGQIDMYYVS